MAGTTRRELATSAVTVNPQPIFTTTCRQDCLLEHLPGGSTSCQLRHTKFDQTVTEDSQQLLEEGRHTFRYDTFGDEDFWGGILGLPEASECTRVYL